MKKRRNIIVIVLSIIIVIGVAIGLYFLLNDKNKLTVAERNWINDNINTIPNINVIDDANVFGKNGSGVFYEFLDDFTKEYKININPITFKNGTNPSGITLGIKTNIDNNDIVFYKDNYVLVSKNNEIISQTQNLSGKTVGILTKDLSYVSTYINNVTNISFTQYESSEELFNALGTDVNYIIIPKIYYLDIILQNNYNILYNFSDIKIYYVLQTNDETLSSILKKYYNNWHNFNEYFDDALFNTFTNSLNITATEVDALQSVVYNYGFVNASPYEVIMGGKYGGIAAVILSKFSNFADVEFNFEKYKNNDKFMDAVNNKEIDLYFNYYNYTDNFNTTDGLSIEYSIALRKDNNTVIKSINSLIGKTVYTQENSKIYDYLKNINGIDIKTFSTTKDLFKLNKKDVILVIDKNTMDYYSLDELDNYSTRYSNYINEEYNFKVRTNSALYNLLNKYISYLDKDEIVLEGLNNHSETIKSGSVVSKIAEYILYFVIIAIVILLIIIRKSKKISIARKIKKDDKMKFIDQLTSLKNRNYLNENIATWNNNTIYPQTIIVVDLNKIQEINDLNGYNEGDKQIKACANILIKTQLDNSEIMRTDGNEFVIYLVGYNQKQVTNYIHKLSKEIKKLPYDFGAEFGYSTILDDIKTIEDALNEAVEDMKKQKGKNEKEIKK
ncbi:MAG: GGDEF domain-containing protein [Bacilli bacterium]